MYQSLEAGLWVLKHIPDHLKTQKICDDAVRRIPFYLEYVPDHLKTHEMCDRVVDIKPWLLKFVADHLKTRRMCDKAVREDAFSLQYIPDWFVVAQEMWYEVFDDDDKLTEWYESYQKRMAQKASIKVELAPFAWHPSRWWDWCVPEDEKKRGRKNVEVTDGCFQDYLIRKSARNVRIIKKIS